MDWNKLSNEKLLEQYQSGEFDAFDAFFRRNHKIVFCFLIKKLGKQEIAEEILQETFFRIHKYILRYDPSKNALNWILTIAQNAMKTALHKHEESDELADIADPNSLNSVDRVELQDEIEDLLRRLDTYDRQILMARLVDEQSFAEIGETHKITTVNARQKFSRILKKLKAISSK